MIRKTPRSSNDNIHSRPTGITPGGRPDYQVLVTNALNTMQEVRGSSLQELIKQIESVTSLERSKVAKGVKGALAALIRSKLVVQLSDSGEELYRLVPSR